MCLIDKRGFFVSFMSYKPDSFFCYFIFIYFNLFFLSRIVQALIELVRVDRIQ